MKLKKVLSVSFAALLVASGLVSCNTPATEITGVSISNKAKIGTDLYVTDTKILEFSLSAVQGDKNYDITFADAIQKEYVKIYSSDETKVSVNNEGKVTALASGEATITVESTKDKTISDNITFTVFDKSVTVDSVAINNEAAFLPNMAINTVKTLDLTLTAHMGRKDAVTLTAASALEQKLISVKAEDTSVLEVNGLNVKALGVGSTKLKVLGKENKTLKEITVQVADRVEGQATIKLIGEKEGGYTVRQGDNLDIPTAVAYDKDGNDITQYITVTSDKDEAFGNDGIFSSNITGNQIITYTAKDKAGAALCQKTINVNVYQRILADGAATIKVENEATAPVIRSEDLDQGLRGFYLPSGLSKQYYAEWKVSKITNASGNMLICAANITNPSTAPTEDYPLTYFGYKPNGSGVELANSKTVKGWNLMWEPRMWSGMDMLNGVITLDPYKGDTRLGVARDGNNVYYFLNGALAYVDVNPDLFELDSMPGIALVGNGTAAPDVTLSDFTILEGEAAMTKLNSVKPESQFRYYAKYGETLAKQPATFQKNGFTYLDKVVDENIGFNDSMVTSNELLTATTTKKWKMSFDMQATKFGDGGNWGKINFDIRAFHDKKTVTKFSVCQYQNAFNEAKFEWSEVGGTDSNLSDDITKAMKGVAANGKFHVELTSYVSGTAEETYGVKISSTGENPVTWSTEKVIKYNNDNKGIAGCPKYVVFHAEKFAGVISNYAVTFENVA